MTSLLSQFFPKCSSCDQVSWELLCASCLERLRLVHICVYCGSKDCRQICDNRFRLAAIRDLYASFIYEGGIRDWLVDMKEHAKPERMVELNRSMLPHLTASYDAIAVISSDPAANRLRRFDWSMILARRLSKLLEIPKVLDCFERQSFLLPLKNLKEDQRRRYLKNLVSLKNRETLFGVTKVLLVDDILTSGASLEVHSTLLGPMVEKIDAYCIARTLRRM